MPKYISKDGVWHPAKEKVPLVDHKGTDGRKKGDPYIYEGPDRAALLELFRAGEDHFGRDFHHDADLLRRIRELGYKNINDYAKAVGWDKEKVEKDFNEKAAKVNVHDLPKKVKAIQQMGGGKDLSGGGQDRLGGFGTQPEK